MPSIWRGVVGQIVHGAGSAKVARRGSALGQTVRNRSPPPTVPAGRYTARRHPPGAPPVNLCQVGHAACGRGLGRRQRCWRSLRTRPHHKIECASTHRAVSADPRTFVVSELSALSGHVRRALSGHVRPGWLIVRPARPAIRSSRLDVPESRLLPARCASVPAGRVVPDQMVIPDGLMRNRRRGTGNRRQGKGTLMRHTGGERGGG